MSTNTEPTPLSVVLGGEALQATLMDGTTVRVFIRALPVRRLQEVLTHAVDEPALIEATAHLVGDDDLTKTPVPQGWADGLTDDSHNALADAARRQNFTRAANWAERQIAANQTLLPLLQKIAGQQLAAAAGVINKTPTTPSPL